MGGSYPSEGRVEVFLNGAWGTVTHDYFIKDPVAQIVCKSLGYVGVAYSYYGSQYGQGTGPIHIDSLSCDGDEASILECSYGPPGSDDDHYEDASVRCQGE